MSSLGRRLGLALEIVRIGHGLALLVRPARAADVAPEHVSRATRLVLRVLGGRHLAQGILTLCVPYPSVRRTGVAVDVAHAASMLALAALVSGPRRRLALSSGSAAAGYAVAECVLLVLGETRHGDNR